MLTKLTIVNAKDSLCTMVQNFRPIVEFAGEGLGYLSLWRIHPRFVDRGTAYISISFAVNLLFVGDYGS